ncbi:syncytin-1 [Camelus ferus]|uniref:Syncytin-1 n=1 Tax=Camelus ferus TaxID=419612 RepID=A0A8B8SBK6_CAMFR|nr:syncytin-1 [Camelus ferus]XP_032327144.1 syncytin-1 [Camelus ferus]XP_032327145.1 syncytin-1 [Camelus ferus]
MAETVTRLVVLALMPSLPWALRCTCVEPGDRWTKYQPVFTAYTYQPSRCYDSASECTYRGRSYWTGTVKASSVSGIKCYGAPGKPVCWTKHTHYGMSDGGGAQDQARRQAVQQAGRRLRQKRLPAREPAGLQPLAKPRNLAPQVAGLLAAVHGILNRSNPNLARDCWLCLRPGPVQHLALPVANLTKAFTTTAGAAASAAGSPRLNWVRLAYKAPECYFNNGTNPLGGSLSARQCHSTSPCVGRGCQPTRGWCANNGAYFVCGKSAYRCLPANWAGLCALAFLSPPGGRSAQQPEPPCSGCSSPAASESEAGRAANPVARGAGSGDGGGHGNRGHNLTLSSLLSALRGVQSGLPTHRRNSGGSAESD